MKPRLTLLLLFAFIFSLSFSFGEEDYIVAVTFSASKTGVTVFLDSDRLGETPSSKLVNQGKHSVEFIASPGKRVEKDFELGEDIQVLVFYDVEGGEINILRSPEKINEFLNEFSEKVRFREYFEKAMKLYRKNKKIEAIRALQEGLVCCHSKEGMELLKKWRTELLPEGFVYIDGGTFAMGIDSANVTDGSSPAHQVTVRDFAISTFEVTNEQFEKFVKESSLATVAELAGKSLVFVRKEAKLVEIEGAYWKLPDGKNGVNSKKSEPVTHISWYDAVACCKWISEANGFCEGAISLPSEAQWEYIARGTNGRLYPWGEADPFSSSLFAVLNELKPARVGSKVKGASPNGVFDIIGNVAEWTMDYADTTYYGSCKESGVMLEPAGPSFGQKRVIRGGSFCSKPSETSSTARRFEDPDYTSQDVGFRLVINFCTL